MMCLESQQFLAKKEHVVVEIENMILNQKIHINNKNKHKIRAHKPNQSHEPFQLPLPKSYQSYTHELTKWKLFLHDFHRLKHKQFYIEGSSSYCVTDVF
jgi:hypothetical protein